MTRVANDQCSRPRAWRDTEVPARPIHMNMFRHPVTVRSITIRLYGTLVSGFASKRTCWADTSRRERPQPLPICEEPHNLVPTLHCWGHHLRQPFLCKLDQREIERGAQGS